MGLILCMLFMGLILCMLMFFKNVILAFCVWCLNVVAVSFDLQESSHRLGGPSLK